MKPNWHPCLDLGSLAHYAGLSHIWAGSLGYPWAPPSRSHSGRENVRSAVAHCGLPSRKFASCPASSPYGGPRRRQLANLPYPWRAVPYRAMKCLARQITRFPPTPLMLTLLHSSFSVRPGEALVHLGTSGTVLCLGASHEGRHRALCGGPGDVTSTPIRQQDLDPCREP